ncbi:hypothetical protein [Phytoactinopolyspora limicola]|nr:hypothetical protein [Phytoactinopolyspora limicola]
MAADQSRKSSTTGTAAARRPIPLSLWDALAAEGFVPPALVEGG